MDKIKYLLVDIENIFITKTQRANRKGLLDNPSEKLEIIFKSIEYQRIISDIKQYNVSIYVSELFIEKVFGIDNLCLINKICNNYGFNCVSSYSGKKNAADELLIKELSEKAIFAYKFKCIFFIILIKFT